MAFYLHAIVDGAKEKMANFVIEPPTLFKGRGEHPKVISKKNYFFS
jgi:DNA topoisomerase I